MPEASLIEVLKNYGPFGIVIGLMYYFFYKYLPDQRKHMEDVVDKHSKNIENVVDKFRQESETRMSANKAIYDDHRNATKEIVANMTASNERIIADMTRSNEKIVGQANDIMNLTQDHSRKMVDSIGEHLKSKMDLLAQQNSQILLALVPPPHIATLTTSASVTTPLI